MGYLTKKNTDILEDIYDVSHYSNKLPINKLEWDSKRLDKLFEYNNCLNVKGITYSQLEKRFGNGGYTTSTVHDNIILYKEGKGDLKDVEKALDSIFKSTNKFYNEDYYNYLFTNYQKLFQNYFTYYKKECEPYGKLTKNLVKEHILYEVEDEVYYFYNYGISILIEKVDEKEFNLYVTDSFSQAKLYQIQERVSKLKSATLRNRKQKNIFAKKDKKQTIEQTSFNI